MNMHSTLCTAILVLGLLVSSSALAHPAPYSHYHPAPKKTKVVYRTTPAPPSRVIIVEEERVVRPRVTIKTPRVTVRRAPALRNARAVIVDTSPRDEVHPYSMLSIGLRTNGAFASEEALPANGLPMGGGGVVLRTRISPYVGIEVAADVMVGDGGDFSQTTIPLFASATYHFLPYASFQPYVVAGMGADFTRKEFLDGRFAYDRIDIGAQAGVGLELFVTDNISLTADARYKVMGNARTDMKMRTDCIATSGSMTGFCDKIQATAPGENFYHGVQFGVGANLHF